MKVLHYFLGFNAAVLAYLLFTQVIIVSSTQAITGVCTCIAFSILSTVSIYNLIQGYKLHKEEY